MTEVEINKEPIELYKILKMENLVESGGRAKHVISEGMVTLNGTIETQKRKKILNGDIIEYDGNTLKVVLV